MRHKLVKCDIDDKELHHVDYANYTSLIWALLSYIMVRILLGY